MKRVVGVNGAILGDISTGADGMLTPGGLHVTPGGDASRNGTGADLNHYRVESVFDSPELRPFEGMSLEEIADRAALKRIDVVAWRDFDDSEAGGSELHAHRIMSAWAKSGLKINMTTSTAPGAPPFIQRQGYRVTRRVGRYSIFPRTMISGVLGRLGRGDGLVEIWNGMPFLSPLWARCPRIVFLHHVHAEMWKMVLPKGLAEMGYAVEHNLAPPVYRRSRIVTLSSSSKEEIVTQLGMSPSQVAVCPPGIEGHFSPGTARSEAPLVVAVGRLVPVKRFELMIEGLLKLKPRLPELQAVIVGEGYERPMLEDLIRKGKAESWISLPGYVSDDGLVDLYRRAWVVASTSLREGWGMTVTEAAACGTPAVASRISGHQDAVVDGQTGLLFDTLDEMADSLYSVLSDEVLRKRLATAALDFSSQFSWDTTAKGALAALAAEALKRR
jgi:glycosyltransferase involved in cell wall biosynthesis